MCIIGIKPKGVEDFKKETFKNCWEGNSDGAGYAWYDEASGLWQVRKGFMKLKEFIETYRSHNFDKNTYSIFHFRNTTAGKTSKGNCHPFPIIENLEEMQQTGFSSSAIAFHNGTVGKGDDKFSDTMYHIREFIAPLLPVWNNPLVREKILFTILDKTISRWLLCVGHEVYRFGKWHDNGQGHSFSNEFFDKKKNTGVIYYSSGYNYYNNDNDPPGAWTSGSYQGENGFWQGGKFTSWKEFYNKKYNNNTWGSLQSQAPVNVPTSTLSEIEATTIVNKINEIKTQEHFENRYFMNTSTVGGKFIRVMDWKQFAKDQFAIKILKSKKDDASETTKWAMGLNTYPTVPNESPIDTKGKSFGEQDTLTMCPFCFETAYVMDSEFNIGDSQCMKCGCVFTEKTGEIHLFDHEVYKSYREGHHV